jgi:hypothetical protein
LLKNFKNIFNKFAGLADRAVFASIFGIFDPKTELPKLQKYFSISFHFIKSNPFENKFACFAFETLFWPFCLHFESPIIRTIKGV